MPGNACRNFESGTPVLDEMQSFNSMSSGEFSQSPPQSVLVWHFPRIIREWLSTLRRSAESRVQADIVIYASFDNSSPKERRETLAIRVQVKLKGCSNPPLQAGARKRQQ